MNTYTKQYGVYKNTVYWSKYEFGEKMLNYGHNFVCMSLV